MIQEGAQHYSRNLVAWILVAVSISGLAIITTGPSASAATSSAVTKSGTGEFSGVKVTVDQTQHLKNQVVRVSWTGAQQTLGNFGLNYMQVMQCWGDGPAPVRDNCVFGAYGYGTMSTPQGGPGVTTREVYDPSFIDPAETLKPDAGATGVRVPFTPVTGASTTAFPNPYYDQNTTNEQPFGRTGADGSGQVFFETQTNAQAPGLGCGNPEPDGSTRNCWLVVVPRGTKEVDGSTPPTLETSPLSQTNWNNAISFRLDFDPLAVTCPIGANEHRLIGQEQAIEAVSSWQPALCGAVGSPFGYTKSTDDVARRQSLQNDPWLAMVSAPVDPSRVTDGRRLVYAPVALGGLGLAFNIDIQPKYRAPADVVAKGGQRVPQLKLNARLVAKLLTQSYWAASRAAKFPPANAEDLTRDKEFLQLNPDFASYQFNVDIYQIIVPEGLADGYRELWQWIASDREASDFIAGTPDPNGMVINPAYKGFDLTRSDFPRADLACRAAPYPNGPVCPADLLAYAGDMHDATRAASRGDALARTVWDAGKSLYVKPALQMSGQREVLALTDAATAARFSLPMASLKNGAGEFVTPTNASMSAAVGAMMPSPVDASVRLPNPGSATPGVYPLTHLTYAVTSPDHLTPEEIDAYSKFLTYVVGPGQAPGVGAGQLPPGYVPLPDDLVAQAKSAIVAISAGPRPAAPNSAAADTTTSDPAMPVFGSGTGSSGGGGTTGAPAPIAVPAAAPGAAAAAKPAAAAAPAPAAFTTPNDLSNSARFALVIALLFSLAAGLAWLIIPLLARRGPPAT